MDLYIKNMVCPRCISAVEGVLSQLEIPYDVVSLGFAAVPQDLDRTNLTRLEDELGALGFELIDDKRNVIVEKIKTIIIGFVHHNQDEQLKRNLSDILREEIGYDYKYLSTIFSEVTGSTIEKFQIKHKIERIKEYIVYDQLSLKEIAFKLGYSSEAYLSNQFKKVTGYTPSQFKQQSENGRIPLDKL